MANELSDSAEVGLLDHLLKETAFPFAAQVRYLGIHIGDPGDDGQSNAEASGSGYTRIQILGTGWSAASGRAILNSGDVDFNEVITSDLTGCTHWTLWNHATNSAASNYLGKAAIPSSPVTFEVGATPSIEDGTFSIGWQSGALSDYAANALLDHLTLKTEFSQPSALYAFLSEGNPGDSFSGVNEPSGNGYARALASAAFAGAAAGATDNDAIILFPKATGDWRSGNALTYAGLYDAVTSGNPLVYFALTSSIQVNNNERPRFPVGDFNLTIN